MRKFFIAVTLALTIPFLVSGCAGFDKVVQFSTIGVENPLTQREYNIGLRSFKAALNPTVTYIELRTCLPVESELASWGTSKPCANYDRQIAAQNALRVANDYRLQMRDFVKQNRMVDARIAYNELERAIAIMRSYKKGFTP